mgnify:CR=1 FL=1
MRVGLLLKRNGEISQINFDFCRDKFDINRFPEYNNFKTYNNYIVLYNDNSEEVNITTLPFTEDKFNGDILLVKIDKNMNIVNFNIESYVKILSKIYIEENDMCYSSDEDIIDTNLFGL